MWGTPSRQVDAHMSFLAKDHGEVQIVVPKPGRQTFLEVLEIGKILVRKLFSHNCYRVRFKNCSKVIQGRGFFGAEICNKASSMRPVEYERFSLEST